MSIVAPRSDDKQEVTRWQYFISQMLSGKLRTALKATTFSLLPGASATPAELGEVVVELTNNTTLTFKAKGSDGVVRSGTITLS